MKEPGGIIGTLSFSPGLVTIGTGMWIAIIMAANVWFIIWTEPEKGAGHRERRHGHQAKAGRLAMLASRTNTVLSIPMLYCMIMQGGVG